MSAVKSGELFAGVGGLGRAVDEVFGTTPAWFAEIDAAPSKVLAHHYPDVPNYGDVTTLIDPPRASVLAGGFPCQDVSLAGRRRGLRDGTRSGLWSEFARLIDTIRPDWVVIENVRGLLSADATGDMESCPWCLGDDGDQHALRALGAVLGDLAELGFDAEWTGLRAADVGAPHGRFRVFILAWPSANTEGVGGGRRRGDVDGKKRAHESGSQRNAERSPTVGGGADALTLLPTPVAQPSGNTPEDHLRKKPGRVVVTDLAIMAENGLIESGGRLLPTPRTTDMNGPGDHGDGGMDLRTVASLLPTPRASRGGSATETMYGIGAERDDDGDQQGNVTVETVPTWGPYEPAIRRWESIIDRPAPAPVRMDGKGGKARLNPELPEWMMGWPAGWVTDPEIGLSRSEQLKAVGNGVCTLQAVAALRVLLGRPGVPALASLSGEVTA